MDIGLLILRIAVGGTLAVHGAHKLLPARHGGVGLDGASGFVESLGFRPAKAWAVVLAFAELLGGLALAVGLGTPIAAGVVIAVMAAAILTVHADKGFFAQQGGYELPFVLAVGALAAAFSGGGEWSLDRALGWHLAGEPWGIGAAAAGLVIGAGAVGARNLRFPRVVTGRRAARA